MSSNGVNKVFLLGHVGNPPSVRQTNNQSVVANLSLATNRSWKDKQTGALREETEWHRVVAFQRLAEIVRDYVKKGTQLHIDGFLRTKKWTDKQGVEKQTTEIVATEMKMLGSSSDNKNQQVQKTSHPANNNQYQAAKNGQSTDPDLEENPY